MRILSCAIPSSWHLRAVDASRDERKAQTPLFLPFKLRGMDLPNRRGGSPDGAVLRGDGVPTIAPRIMAQSVGRRFLYTEMPACRPKGRITPGARFVEEIRAMPGGASRVRSRNSQTIRYACSWDYSGRKRIHPAWLGEDGPSVPSAIGRLSHLRPFHT